MPAFVFALLAGLAPLLEALFFRLLVAVGIGIGTYVGVGSLFDSIQSNLIASFTGASADVLAFAYLLNIDRAINLVFSAIVARLTLAGMSALGSVSRFKVGG